MRIENFLYTVEIPEESEKFSVFRIEGELLRFGEESKRQDLYLFGRVEEFDYSDKIYNSGERWIEIWANSREEQVELSQLFRRKGFKTKCEKLVYGEFSSRVYIDLDGLNIDHNITFGNELLYPGEYCFILRLYKKDLQRFLGFLGELSEKYKYRTIYQDTCSNRLFKKVNFLIK